jgi:hypothetical protein
MPWPRKKIVYNPIKKQIILMGGLERNTVRDILKDLGF